MGMHAVSQKRHRGAAIPLLVLLTAGSALLLPLNGLLAFVAIFFLVLAVLVRVVGISPARTDKEDSNRSAESLVNSSQFTIGEMMFTVLYISLILLAFRLLGPERTAGLKYLLLGWAVGMLPLAYLLVWGGKVADWIFD